MMTIRLPGVYQEFNLFLLDCSIQECATYYQFKLRVFYRVRQGLFMNPRI